MLKEGIKQMETTKTLTAIADRLREQVARARAAGHDDPDARAELRQLAQANDDEKIRRDVLAEIAAK